jgi:tetratricopeptide (TPR) repeat protein
LDFFSELKIRAFQLHKTPSGEFKGSIPDRQREGWRSSMRVTSSDAAASGNVRFFFLLFVLIGTIYSNSLQAIWILDDQPNILQNPRLHIEDLLPETLYQTIFSPQHLDSKDNPQLNRPLARLSFALNWYFGKDSPAGYRIVNICIHFLTAFVLFLTIRALLGAPRVAGKYAGRENSIALLAATLWAVNPIQTQAVVYIVQRMASLSCFFYLLGIWGYIRGRTSEECRHRMLFFLMTLVSFLAGIGSKENAFLLPASLLLLEFTFFQDLSQPKVRRRFGCSMAACLGVLLMGGGWLFAEGKLSGYLDYSGRLFSPWERLLTEPRIVLYYLSQIFYPVPTRLSIDHDVELSHSLFEPWVTLPAILAVLALIVFALLQARKRPLVSFAVLFFFLNHVIESSVIGLELIFEHRNYLPSLFLFVPVACGLQWLTDHYRTRSQGFQYVIILFVILLMTGLGVSTHIRNMAWLDAKTFWEDAVRKAPLAMRPVHNLAYDYYEKNGHYQAAFELYSKELKLRGYNQRDISVAHVNLANHYYRLGDFGKASEHLDKALANMPDFELVQYRQAFVLARTENLPRALDIISPLVARRPAVFDYNYLIAQILMKMGRSEEALSYLGRCLRLSPGSARALTMMGVALNLNGHYQRAEWFFTAAIDRLPGEKRTLLWMIDCKLQRSEKEAAERYVLQFLDGIPANQIQDSISKTLDDQFMPAGSRERLSRWIWSLVHAQAAQMLKKFPR